MVGRIAAGYGCGGRAAGRGDDRHRRHQGRRRRTRGRRLHQHRRRRAGPGRGRHPPAARRVRATSSSSAATIGVHGIAIMSVREGLSSAPRWSATARRCNGLVAAMLDVCPTCTCCATRPGAASATSLNEIARRPRVGVELIERALPVPDAVANACALLGLDPLYVANEGKLLAFVPPRRRGRRARGDAGASARRGRGGHRRVRAEHSGHGRDQDRLRRHPGRRHCRSASNCRGSASQPGVPGVEAVAAGRGDRAASRRPASGRWHQVQAAVDVEVDVRAAGRPC